MEAGLIQITIQHACPAWPAKKKLRMTLDCSIIAKEIMMVSGNLLREGARLLCFILARGIDILKKENLRSKLVDLYCSKQDEHKQQNLKTNLAVISGGSRPSDKGGPWHQNPEIREGCLIRIFLRPFWSQFSLRKRKGGRAPLLDLPLVMLLVACIVQGLIFLPLTVNKTTKASKADYQHFHTNLFLWKGLQSTCEHRLICLHIFFFKKAAN